jgi:hypothetical protein
MVSRSGDLTVKIVKRLKIAMKSEKRGVQAKYREEE